MNLSTRKRLKGLFSAATALAGCAGLGEPLSCSSKGRLPGGSGNAGAAPIGRARSPNPPPDARKIPGKLPKAQDRMLVYL
jgi:hypothetical protein